MAKLSFSSASTRSLHKLYQLNTSLFLCISKCKQQENSRKENPNLNEKTPKTHKKPNPINNQPPHRNTFTLMSHVFLQKTLIPLHASRILSNAVKLLRSYSTFQEQTRRAQASCKSGNCM